MEKGEALRDLHEHQKRALADLHNGAILWGEVGTGKSRVALKYWQLNESPRKVYVITTAKKRDSIDWITEASVLNVNADLLTVDSWNNIKKYEKVYGAFFIFDEQRLVGRGEWVKAFLRISRKNHWIMLSATPGDTWMEYIPVFVANGFYKNRTDFIEQHVEFVPFSKYPKVKRYHNVARLVKHRNNLLVRMRFYKETIRHTKIVWTDYDVEQWETVVKKRWNPWLDKPIRDAGELFALMRRVVNGDPSRVRAVEGLLRAHNRLIVFYNFNYELEALRGLYGSVPMAEWNGHKHEEIPDTEKWLYLVQYTAGSEGWNCISTDAMCFYSLTSSYKKWEQAHGRIDRLNTPFLDLFYHVLRSKTQIDSAIWRSLGAKKDFNFNDFDLKMLDWN